MADKPLILIIDDEPDFLEIFGTKLSSVGFRVETAEGAEEGIRKAKELHPALILMDVQMPKITGADAVLKLREDPATRDIKVVFLTCLGDPRGEMAAVNQRLSKEFGAQGYIKKTDDLETLAERVRAYLE